MVVNLNGEDATTILIHTMQVYSPPPAPLPVHIRLCSDLEIRYAIYIAFRFER